MGTLAPFLQDRFEALCPKGWRCHREVRILPQTLEEVLGYSSRSDIVLEREDDSRRLWIEFEVSRADPVANHVKFATSNLFNPVPAGSAFLSMVSPHVVRGRRNLASATVHLMRRLGMEAYQTTLLPDRSKDEVSRLNCLDFANLRHERINVKREIARAMAVSEPVLQAERVRVHYAGELLEVMLSLRRFNTDLADGAGTISWGQRIFRFFVFDPTSGQFAPSKFCAYLPFTNDATLTPSDVLASREMTVALYTRIEATAKRFDGNKAWKHLTRQLGMTMYNADELPELRERFNEWLAPRASLIAVHPDGPEFLTPPPWFA